MARRRDNGQGSISPHMREGIQDGWHGKLVLPSGTRKDVYGKTKADVQSKLRQLQREVDAGLHGTKDADASVLSYLTMWLEGHASHIGEKTASGYESLIRLHTGSIAKVSLNDLKPIHIQKLYTADLQRYSASTVHHVHEMLHLAFNDAVQLGLIPRNPTDFVKAPGLKSKVFPTLSRSQVTALIEGSQGVPFGVLHALTVTTGLREAELLGLAWADIDVSRSVLYVRNTLHCYPNQVFKLKPPKSRSSRRTIPVAPMVMRMLEQHRKMQEEDRALVGKAYSNDWPLVFRNPIGMPMRYEFPLRHLRKLLRTLGEPTFSDAFVSELRFHDLRHTFATLLIEDGVPIRVVSELLGHSSIGITLQIYGHVTPKMQDMASQTIEGWLPTTLIDSTIVGETR